MSEDWEKDFDLDMTEEEVQLALSKADATAEVLLKSVVFYIPLCFFLFLSLGYIFIHL